LIRGNTPLDSAQGSSELSRNVSKTASSVQIGFSDLCPEFVGKWNVGWAPYAAPPGTGVAHACPYSLGNPDTLLFCNRGQDGDYGVFENPARIEVLLGEATVVHAIGCEPVEMLEGLEDTFAREPINRPEKQNFKLTLRRRAEHGLKIDAIRSRAGFTVNKLLDDNPILPTGELSQLNELVFNFLAFVPRRDPCVQGCAPKVVHQHLRHADDRTTLQIYGHVVGDGHREAVEKVAAALDTIGRQPTVVN
jgi:hypothetical protein